MRFFHNNKIQLDTSTFFALKGMKRCIITFFQKFATRKKARAYTKSILNMFLICSER